MKPSISKCCLSIFHDSGFLEFQPPQNCRIHVYTLHTLPRMHQPLWISERSGNRLEVCSSGTTTSTLLHPQTHTQNTPCWKRQTYDSYFWLPGHSIFHTKSIFSTPSSVVWLVAPLFAVLWAAMLATTTCWPMACHFSMKTYISTWCRWMSSWMIIAKVSVCIYRHTNFA